MSAPDGTRLRVKLKPHVQAQGAVDLTGIDDANEAPRSRSHELAGASGRPEEQHAKRHRNDFAQGGGLSSAKRPKSGVAAPPPPAAAGQPNAGELPRQGIKIRFSAAATAGPPNPAGADASGAGRDSLRADHALPPSLHQLAAPGGGDAPRTAPLGPSHAAQTRKFVRQRAQPPALDGGGLDGGGGGGGSASSSGVGALTAAVAALRTENDALRAEVAEAQRRLDGERRQVRRLEAEVQAVTFEGDEANAQLQRERWEREQEQQANEQWRRDIQARLDEEHAASADAARRADALQRTVDSVRSDPGAMLQHLRETAAFAQLPGPRLADLREELDRARVIVADVQAKRAAEAQKPLECVVCLDHALQRVAFGCGHSACTRCEGRLVRCPVCNAPVRSRLMLYL